VARLWTRERYGAGHRGFMDPFRRILFPVDFSKASLNMASYVREMADRFAATVTVVHAFDLLRDYVDGPDELDDESESPAIPYTAAVQAIRNARRRRLEEFAAAQLPNASLVTRVEDGAAAAVIEWEVQREGIGLIMMPTKGLGKFRRMLLGSVTAKVLHDVTCPMFTSVHDCDVVPAIAGYGSIVCAVDVNQECDAVLEAASFLAQAYRAKLCLAHIPSAPPGSGESEASELLRRALAKVINQGNNEPTIPVKVRMWNEEVTQGIRVISVEEKAELLIVGRGHERGNVSRLWSHLYAIIRDSHCPVLSV